MCLLGLEFPPDHYSWNEQLPQHDILPTSTATCLFILLATTAWLWDRCSPTRDWIWALCSENAVLTMRKPGKSLFHFVLYFIWLGRVCLRHMFISNLDFTVILQSQRVIHLCNFYGTSCGALCNLGLHRLLLCCWFLSGTQLSMYNSSVSPVICLHIWFSC